MLRSRYPKRPDLPTEKDVSRTSSATSRGYSRGEEVDIDKKLKKIRHKLKTEEVEFITEALRKDINARNAEVLAAAQEHFKGTLLKIQGTTPSLQAKG